MLHTKNTLYYIVVWKQYNYFCIKRITIHYLSTIEFSTLCTEVDVHQKLRCVISNAVVVSLQVSSATCISKVIQCNFETPLFLNNYYKLCYVISLSPSWLFVDGIFLSPMLCSIFCSNPNTSHSNAKRVIQYICVNFLVSKQLL